MVIDRFSSYQWLQSSLRNQSRCFVMCTDFQNAVNDDSSHIVHYPSFPSTHLREIVMSAPSMNASRSYRVVDDCLLRSFKVHHVYRDRILFVSWGKRAQHIPPSKGKTIAAILVRVHQHINVINHKLLLCSIMCCVHGLHKKPQTPSIKELDKHEILKNATTTFEINVKFPFQRYTGHARLGISSPDFWESI